MNTHAKTMNRELHFLRTLGIFISMILLINPILDPYSTIHVQAQDGNPRITELDMRRRVKRNMSDMPWNIVSDIKAWAKISMAMVILIGIAVGSKPIAIIT
jgi:hypothetical protein